MPETELSFKIDGGANSCTVVLGKTVLFIGGSGEPNQISQLYPVGLIRIGTLPFSMCEGTCLVMNQQLFLGFGYYNRRSGWSR